ncbi:hypothetical protein NL676_023497 [Syzygium grande]|nr:hypothetical protein NL676_023497 [Syzygium grande]
MSSLGEDVDREILRRLPVKSLLRFKCVCKGWCSLISTPEFAKTHLETAASPPRILLATDPPQSVSCGSPHDDDDDGGGGDHAGREGMALTQRQSPVEVPDGCRARIVGYCNGNAFDVLELKTGSWRRVHEKHDDLNYRPEVGTYANGFLHWVVLGRDSWEPEKIVSFCMSKEKFDDALLPLPEADEGTGFGVLGVVGACLLIFESMAEEYLFLEWMMSDYGVRSSSSWTKLCSVNLPNQTLIAYFNMRPLCSTIEGKIAFSSISETWSSMILRNVMTKRFVKEDKLDFAVYVESLVSPHGAKPQNQYVSRVKDPMEKIDFTGDHSACKEGETSYEKADGLLISKRRRAS